MYQTFSVKSSYSSYIKLSLNLVDLSASSINVDAGAIMLFNLILEDSLENLLLLGFLELQVKGFLSRASNWACSE